jgi:DHA2 family multidrug resistance protein
MTTNGAPQGGGAPKPPIAALCLAAFGALVGGTFPISVIFAMGDIGGGLSASADDAAWITTLYNVGQLIGQPLLVILVGSFGRGRAMQLSGAGFAAASLHWRIPCRASSP